MVDAQNPDWKISSLNESEWKVLVDGVEKHILSETTTAKEVKAAIDNLNLKGQKFESVPGLSQTFHEDKWETRTPLTLTHTSSATVNSIQLDELI
ncbi:MULTISPECIES: hypothetical protein [Bacillus cereus group]|uniref:Uncharacterized protein n=1 Tax=Bacillus cereus VD021 TaxID=1053224 RepID=R8HF75_BACCE|nr:MULTISPECIES: hypothetical protein [Bacillus cereus group]EOO71505.1 hypothetical protein IIC_04365 [Bacillus cereus VD021]MCQ6569297.1 hypothetical protein [Bacillus mycoides]